MVSTPLNTLATGLVIAFVGHGALAQDEGLFDDDEPETRAAEHTTAIVKGSTLIGCDVKNAEDETVGTIEDLIFEENGCILAALVAAEDVDGDGLTGVPFELLRREDEPVAPADDEHQGYDSYKRLDDVDVVYVRTEIQEPGALYLVDSRSLRTAPRWREDDADVPRTNAHTFVASVYDHFGTDLDASRGRHHAARDFKATSCVRARQIMDREVEDIEGEDVGEIADVALSLEDDRLLYAVLERGGILGMGETRIALPLTAVDWQGSSVRQDDEALSLRVAVAELTDAEGFDDWPAQPNHDLSAR